MHAFRVHSCVLGSAAVVAGWLAGVSTASAEQQGDSLRNTFGEIGMLDMPSAHMADDGQFAFTMGDVGTTQRYVLSFQALPWLEASFRYSHVPGFDSDPNFYDRSFGTKIRLWRESTYMPDISVGLRDILGTGIYSSEYLAASKHIGNFAIGSFDLTGGIGWGRLSDTGELPNPLGYALSSFKTRDPNVAATGGLVNFKQFFHGPRIGVLGGAIWNTPIDGLSLLAEYSPDKYKKESLYPTHGVYVKAPFNVGLNYQIGALSVSGGWFYGTTYGFAVTIHGDSADMPKGTPRIGPEVPPALVRDSSERQGALRQMMDRNSNVAIARNGGPWVQVPTPLERTKQELKQALLSESRGVRDLNVEGATLVIDARPTGDAMAQCLGYARIASAINAHTTSIAMTDLQGSKGDVTFCPVATTATYTVADARDTQASSGVVNASDQAAVLHKVRADLVKQDMYAEALSLSTNELWIYYDNYRYRDEAEAAGRVARVLMADAPPSIEVFHLVTVQLGIPQQQITIARGALERATSMQGAPNDIGQAVSLSSPPLDNPVLERVVPDIYPKFSWSLDPKMTEHLFDPFAPLQFLFYADAAAVFQVTPHWGLDAQVTAKIWSNYTFTRDAGSQLPHVRTDLLKYLKEGAYGISNARIVYQSRLTPDVFVNAQVGYLEDMYMGAGGQVLWRPENSRFAFGMDLYQVWKRDFNRLFGAQSYNVLTGHFSIYYQSPWYGLNFKVHAGRYLAGDHGATFEITREFRSGVEIGAWATFTNVPFSKFGEGSFDKGIIFRIPFEWGLPIYSQSAYEVRLNSLTRDGGQRLGDDDSLYDATRRTSYGEIAQHLDEIVEP